MMKLNKNALRKLILKEISLLQERYPPGKGRQLNDRGLSSVANMFISDRVMDELEQSFEKRGFELEFIPNSFDSKKGKYVEYRLRITGTKDIPSLGRHLDSFTQGAADHTREQLGNTYTFRLRISND